MRCIAFPGQMLFATFLKAVELAQLVLGDAIL